MKDEQKLVNEILVVARKLKPRDEEALLAIKRSVCKKLKIAHAPTNILILKKYRQLVKSKKIMTNLALENILKTRAVRTMSGVAVISVLTKSQDCPGNCLFCPTEKNMPKSYLSNEPAVMRAILNNFDPYKQVANRIKALHMTGHLTDKCELIVIGGTWSSLNKKYQTSFIKRCYDGFNGTTSKNLAKATQKNEKAKNRMIGMTLETRPDYINEAEVKRMRMLGATRVELGVQTTIESVLEKNRRNHTLAQTVEATKLLKQAGFKITYHFMPGMYGSTPAKDLRSYQELFSNKDFQPDQVKIYPCVVTKNSDLYKLYKNKTYKPYSDKVLINLLKKIKLATPPYVRIARLIRDIPSVSIEAGNKITNLRQIIQKEFHDEKLTCRCIRCHEAKGKQVTLRDIKLVKRQYKASDGTEIFLSYESRDKKTLYAFLRLRLQKNVDWYPALENAALVRELHTYGELMPLKSKSKKVQHIGLGKRLMKEAEKLSKQKGYSKMAVISGVGVRGYYEKLGYKLEDEYMIKNF